MKKDCKKGKFLMYRSNSLPNIHRESDEYEYNPYIYIQQLQKTIQDLNNKNTLQEQTILILQNQLAEKKEYLDILIKAPDTNRKQRNKSSIVHQKQLFYKQNKNNPHVIKILHDTFGKVFAQENIPIPWQVVKSVTDKLFMEQLGRTKE